MFPKNMKLPLKSKQAWKLNFRKLERKKKKKQKEDTLNNVWESIKFVWIMELN